MKRLLQLLILFLCPLFYSEVRADAYCITVNLTQQESIDDPYKQPSPSKGHRSLPSPIVCVIDFSKGTVQTTLTSEIISYEIWDSDGTALVAQYIDEPDFVGLLCDVSGLYQFRFITESYQYIGYIELPGK